MAISGTNGDTLFADIVIAGGGSAGCVLARRLANALPSQQIVLFEAGENLPGFLTEIPGMTVRIMGQPRTDWCYAAEQDSTIGGRVLRWSGGRMLGGGSSINGLVYIRGLRRDYDAWAAAGCPGWSWNDVEPWFRKAERLEGASIESMGVSGPYTVSRIRSLHPMTEQFIEACGQLGLPKLADYNRADRAGVFVNLTSQARGRRSSTANRYLGPRTPKNLSARTPALVITPPAPAAWDPMHKRCLTRSSASVGRSD